MPSIVGKIEEVEGHVQTCEKRLDAIERKLRLCDLTEKERCSLEDEDKKLQSTLEKHRSELRSLRFENFKTMLVSVVLLFFIYGIFYLYTSGSDTSRT